MTALAARVATIVRGARLELGYSVGQAAGRAGVAVNSWRRAEDGQRVRPELLGRMAAVLELSGDERAAVRALEALIAVQPDS